MQQYSHIQTNVSTFKYLETMPTTIKVVDDNIRRIYSRFFFCLLQFETFHVAIFSFPKSLPVKPSCVVILSVGPPLPFEDFMSIFAVPWTKEHGTTKEEMEGPTSS